jgi:hypothetical protein
MASVIVNEEGELYGGFGGEGSKPIWFKTKRADCIIDDDNLAKMALKQLHALGYDKTCIRDANGIIRKWVPSEVDASANDLGAKAA